MFLHKVCQRNHFKNPNIAEWDSKVIMKKTFYFGLSSLFVEKSHQKTPAGLDCTQAEVEGNRLTPEDRFLAND